MICASSSDLKTVTVCYVAIVAISFGFLLQSSQAFGQDAPECLPTLQQKIIHAAVKAKPSVVHITWRHHDFDESASGVILTADGYVATFFYMSYRAPESRYETHIPAGKSVSVTLADGRRVSGVVVGSYSSEKHLNFDLVKITDKGIWPCAELGRTEAPKPGQICLALGFPPGPGDSREREPSVRIGHLIPWGVSGMLRSSCVMSPLDDRGGGLFDLDGRLIGIHLFQTFSDYQTFSKPTACHLDINVIEQNWRSLTDREPPADGPMPDPPTASDEALRDAVVRTVPSADAPELAETATKAREVTVALTEGNSPHGCSGTIVTTDGYIATCAHHQLARGTRTTVYFADGRTAPATFLGRDDVLDIGLAKISASGPWPCAALGKVADVKAGDPCIIAGYPNYLRKQGKVPLVVRGARIADNHYAPTETLSYCQVWGGDSGGGLFDGQGRLIGVLSGPATPRKVSAHAGADGFAALWDFLVDGPALGDAVPFEESSAAAAVGKAVESAPSIVCEVLGDGKRRALGTIITSDGSVLTKASELYGTISCRLASGRELPADVHHVAREHDLALLKIDVTGLPQIDWSQRDEIPVGTLVAALKVREPPTMGVVSHAVHAVAPETGYLAFGNVKDTAGGIEVEQVHGWWKTVVEDVQTRRVSAQRETPVRVGDVILSIEGRPMLTVNVLEQLATRRSKGRGWEVPFVIAGDPICVTLRRDGEEQNLRFPLLSAKRDFRKTSPRSGSFPAVFDTDVSLTSGLCGGPLVDYEGRVVGITIAVPATALANVPVAPRVFVIPAAIARAAVIELK